MERIIGEMRNGASVDDLCTAVAYGAANSKGKWKGLKLCLACWRDHLAGATTPDVQSRDTFETPRPDGPPDQWMTLGEFAEGKTGLVIEIDIGEPVPWHGEHRDAQGTTDGARWLGADITAVAYTHKETT